ncbi:hypothetical protein Tco_0282603 [Tanacetum coccineum]
MTTSKLSSLISMRSILKGGIFSIEGRDVDMKLLLAPESNNALAKCWSGSICFDSFLPSRLLWLVIIVVVVGVDVTVVVVVAFPVFTTGVPIGPVFLLGLLIPAIDAACASRAAVVTSSELVFVMAELES